MVPDGYINGWNGRQLEGWAFDRARPDEAVELEFELGTGQVIRSFAAEYREDLKIHGIGNGRHSFSVSLPAFSDASGKAQSVRVRILGNGFELHGSPFTLPQVHPLAFIAGDIVSNCNLRCPFCLVDYSLIKGLKLMPADTFKHLLNLLPLVPDGGFWLSCLHEPTLHPALVDFIEMAPVALRRKFSFTTNFCKKLDDSYLARLADSGIHSVRVSFDSLNPDLFKNLRRGGRFEVFEDNLRRFAEFRRKASSPPILHLISMALRDNLAELPEMVRQGSNLYGAAVHEVRFMYYLPHIADWGLEHMLNLEQWAGLEARLKADDAHKHLQLLGPEPGVLEKFAQHEGLEKYFPMESPFGGSGDPMDIPLLSPEEAGRLAPDEPFRMRLRWDGMSMIEQIPEVQHRAYLPRLPDPATYLLRMRLTASLKTHQENRKSTNCP